METNEQSNKQQPVESKVEEERRRQEDRRDGVMDRRLGLDRRRGPGRRRSEDRRTAEEGQMSDEQFEFLMAINEYKRANARPFPTWTEVLEVIKAMGYRKVAEPGRWRNVKKTPKAGKRRPKTQGRRDEAPSFAKDMEDRKATEGVERRTVVNISYLGNMKALSQDGAFLF